jgi:hypothetical protein
MGTAGADAAPALPARAGEVAWRSGDDGMASVMTNTRAGDEDRLALALHCNKRTDAF